MTLNVVSIICFDTSNKNNHFVWSLQYKHLLWAVKLTRTVLIVTDTLQFCFYPSICHWFCKIVHYIWRTI